VFVFVQFVQLIFKVKFFQNTTLILPLRGPPPGPIAAEMEATFWRCSLHSYVTKKATLFKLFLSKTISDKSRKNVAAEPVQQ
jgi:hypothetical protein